jgi:peptidoglycan biosynthesis protein MviN/MurJ (putative lipid II flippase)
VATINFLLLYALMRRHTRRLETRQMLVALAKICVAGALLALVCWTANYLWLDAWSDMRFFQKLAILLMTIAFAGAAFFGAAFLLRISEVQDIIDVFRRKVRKL